MDVSNDAQTVAAALNHSAFNMANALGAWPRGRGARRSPRVWAGRPLAVSGRCSRYAA